MGTPNVVLTMGALEAGEPCLSLVPHDNHSTGTAGVAMPHGIPALANGAETLRHPGKGQQRSRTMPCTAQCTYGDISEGTFMLQRAGDRCHDARCVPAPTTAPMSLSQHTVPHTPLTGTASPPPASPSQLTAAAAAGRDPHWGQKEGLATPAHPARRDVSEPRDKQHPSACRTRRELAQTPKHHMSLYPQRGDSLGQVTLGISSPKARG